MSSIFERDDNRDDNGGFFDDNRRPDASSPKCSNMLPIESSVSRCTASITST
jgi:hypothetical protein